MIENIDAINEWTVSAKGNQEKRFQSRCIRRWRWLCWGGLAVSLLKFSLDWGERNWLSYEVDNFIVASGLAAIYFGNLGVILVEPNGDLHLLIDKSRIFFNHHFRRPCTFQHSTFWLAERCSRSFFIDRKDIKTFGQMTKAIIELLHSRRLPAEFSNELCWRCALQDRLHSSDI